MRVLQTFLGQRRKTFRLDYIVNSKWSFYIWNKSVVIVLKVEGKQKTFCKKSTHKKNRGFTLKRHQVFSIHTTLEEFKSATRINKHLSSWICVWRKLVKTLSGKSHDNRDAIGFSKYFPSAYRRTRRFHIPPFWRAVSKTSVFVTD